MLLLFRSGWFHLIFGVLLLGGAIFLVDFQRGDLGETYSFLGKTAWLNPELLFWLPLAILGHLVIYAAITLLCILIAPKTFPRWWFSSLQGVYRNLNLLREHYEEGKHQGSAWWVVILILAILFVLIGLSVYMIWRVLYWIVT